METAIACWEWLLAAHNAVEVPVRRSTHDHLEKMSFFWESSAGVIMVLFVLLLPSSCARWPEPGR